MKYTDTMDIPTADVSGLEAYVKLSNDKLQTQLEAHEITLDQFQCGVSLNFLILDNSKAVIKAGWYVDPVTGQPKPRAFDRDCMLIVSEIAEAYEGYRKELMSDHIEGFSMVEEEFADVLIRMFDTAGQRGLRLAEAYIAKRKYNEIREDHKLENRAKDGGKKF